MKNTFKDAYDIRKEPKKIIFHSDRGVQYTSFEFREFLKTLKVDQSFSNTGNPYDNAVVESFFSIIKREEINRINYDSFITLKDSIKKYIFFYNNNRPHSFLKGKSPNEYEKNTTLLYLIYKP